MIHFIYFEDHSGSLVVHEREDERAKPGNVEKSLHYPRKQDGRLTTPATPHRLMVSIPGRPGSS